MFTGIITHQGIVQLKDNKRFVFKADPSFCNKLSHGTSIAINGICLTVANRPGADSFSIEVMPETEQKTMIGSLKEGDKVNLELPATTETMLSGHIVQGHVDGVGTIASIKPEGNSKILRISIPSELSSYLVDKGSIAVNGISLTIIEAQTNSFTVGIISYTWEHTMLHTIKEGDPVNIEVDILAKYVKRLLNK